MRGAIAEVAQGLRTENEKLAEMERRMEDLKREGAEASKAVERLRGDPGEGRGRRGGGSRDVGEGTEKDPSV
jgi:hypothetical protein